MHSDKSCKEREAASDSHSRQIPFSTKLVFFIFQQWKKIEKSAHVLTFYSQNKNCEHCEHIRQKTEKGSFFPKYFFTLGLLANLYGKKYDTSKFPDWFLIWISSVSFTKNICARWFSGDKYEEITVFSTYFLPILLLSHILRIYHSVGVSWTRGHLHLSRTAFHVTKKYIFNDELCEKKTFCFWKCENKNRTDAADKMQLCSRTIGDLSS